MITPHIRATAALFLLVVGAAGCGDRKPKPPELAEVFPNLPLPPQSRFVSQAGGEDAIQLTFNSKASQEQVESYYKHVFSSGGWRLVNRTKTADGSLMLLADQKGPPLWVRIAPTGPSGTVVQLSGARTADAAGGSPRPADSAPPPAPPRS